MAARFLVTGGNGNWTSTTNWSATSGGVSGASAPTASDDVTFDVLSLNANIALDTSSRSALTWTVTSGWAGTITFTNNLAVSGSVTLGANMVFAGAGGLTFNATGTLTSNGKTIPQPLTFGATSMVATLADSWVTSGAVLITPTGSVTINGNTLTVGGSITFSTTTGTVSGTTNIVMNGTGTIAMASVTSGSFRNNFEINTAGTVTFGLIHYRLGIFKYTTGTVASTGTIVQFDAASTVTANASGLNFSTLTIASGTQTWNGTSGFTMASLIYTASAVGGITATVGNTYSVTTLLQLDGISPGSQKFTLQSSSASSTFNFNSSAATQALSYVTATDVDSSGGNAIYNYNGTDTRTVNWTTGASIAAPGGGFVPAMTIGTEGVSMGA